MASGTNQTYRYLDTEDDRRLLVEDIRRVRELVLQLAENVPEDRHYEPRYHDWSLAALLAHLRLSDQFYMLVIKLALIGFRVRITEERLNSINNWLSKVLQNRLVATTVAELKTGEEPIADFIMSLPIEQFTKQVYVPVHDEYLTVERAVQVAFLFHWQQHLATLQRVEGIFYEPPGQQDKA